MRTNRTTFGMCQLCNEFLTVLEIRVNMRSVVACKTKKIKEKTLNAKAKDEKQLEIENGSAIWQKRKWQN